jgi:hypothetical protein
VPKKFEAQAALANCRAPINQINAGLSAEKLLVNVSSAAELLFYLAFAASALTKSAPRTAKTWGDEKSPSIIGGADGPAPAVTREAEEGWAR